MYRFYVRVKLCELIISMGAAGLLVSNYCVITNPHVIRLRGLNEAFNWRRKAGAGPYYLFIVPMVTKFAAFRRLGMQNMHIVQAAVDVC